MYQRASFLILVFYRHERQEAKFFLKTPSDVSLLNRSEPSKEVDDLARKVIGAAIEVHRALGPGYIESVYEEALAYEIGLNHIPYERQVKVRVTYRPTYQFQRPIISRSRSNQEKPENRGAGVRPHPYFRVPFQLS